MNSLWYIIDFVRRIINGERFRKATPDEKKGYAFSLNLLALLVLFYPWFIFLIENYSHIVIWLWVMVFLIPAVTLMWWNKESLPLKWNVCLSLLVIAVPITFAVLSLFEIRLKYNRTTSFIAFAAYFTLLILIRCVITTGNDEKDNNIDPQ